MSTTIVAKPLPPRPRTATATTTKTAPVAIAIMTTFKIPLHQIYHQISLNPPFDESTGEW